MRWFYKLPLRLRSLLRKSRVEQELTEELRFHLEELMEESRGRIDVALAEKFMADHYDAYAKKEQANERTLCGHVYASPRGVEVWEWPAHYPGGAVQGKAIDSRLAKDLSFYAHLGHPCGEDFLAGPFLKAHAEFAWQAPLHGDMKAGPWTLFRAGDRAR